MTTHELATLLEHLQLAFGASLKTAASGSLTEAAAAFREQPDENLRAFLTAVRRANAPQPAASAGTGALVERIRAIRNGTAPAGEVIDLSKLKKDQLKEILKEFKQPVGGTNPELAARVRQLCVRTDETTTAPVAIPVQPPLDMNVVEAGVKLYKQLTDDRQLSILDVRAGFAPIREYPKPVVEEISRRAGYTPAGSREHILDKLLTNLEGIKMSQHRADRIMTGTSG